MKLVTLLAQNLPAWPNDSEDGIKWITQDKNGDIFTWDDCGAPRLSKHFDYREWESDSCPWGQVDGNYDTCEDWGTAVVTEQAYYKEKERLLHKQQEWIPGVTLPPVGTKCVLNLKYLENYQEEYPFVENGVEVEIIAHYHTGCSDVAIFRYEAEPNHHLVAQAIAESFVPIKTQEQIEEEETKKVIESVVGGRWLHWSPRLIADALYDAGVRIVK